MKMLQSIEEEIRGVVTYELPSGQRVCFDARALRKHGMTALLRAEGLEEFIPTKRLMVMQNGTRVGTMAPDFDPSNVRSSDPFWYDPRPGDFRREGDAWIAARNLGPGDLDAVDGFERDPNL